MLTAKGRLTLVLALMIGACALCFAGLASSANGLRPNIQDYIEHQR